MNELRPDKQGGMGARLTRAWRRRRIFAMNPKLLLRTPAKR